MKSPTERLLNVLGVAVLSIITVLIALSICFFYLVASPSRQIACGGRTMGSPDPAIPRITRFRGEVVGKNLSIVQYRWLRRRFKAVGTTLGLSRILPSTEYKGNVVQHGERVADVVIDRSGRFDFGDLRPGQYSVLVTYPGEDATEFEFVIDASSQSDRVLIDASPAYYCNCCGWAFEPR